MTDIDEQAQWDALKELLVATDLGDHVYDYGQVPGTNSNAGQVPTTHLLLQVERRYAPPNKANGTDRSGWRATARCVGSTPANARLVMQWVRQAFEPVIGHGVLLTIDGATSTPITHESTNSVAPDDRMYSGSSQWTWAF